MKKILNALFMTLLAVFTFSSCSDVPAPYDILGEGDVPGLTGDGTKENPYNIEAAQQKQDGSIAWVQGYIVGAIENVYDDKGEFAGNKASFTAPFNITSNVLIAESPDETNESKCLPVKIKNGSDLANALNLKDHPENKGGVLLIQGELSAGFGKAALINTTAAVFNNKEIGEEQGGETPGGSTTITENQPYSVSFASDLAGFAVENKVSEGLTGDVWYYSKKYTAATASSYNGSTNVPAEGWFLSPVLDMTAISKATLTFEHSSYSEGKPEELMLKVREENATSWTDLVISNYSNGRDNHVTTTVDLTAFAAKKAQIAFVYKNLAGGTNNTWYIYNLKVAAGEGGGETPGEGTELLTNGGFEIWADGYPTGWKSVSTASSATLEQSTDKRSGTYSVLVKGDPSGNKRLGSTEMTLKAGTYVFSAYFKAATADSKASAALGYVPIGEDGTIGGSDYKYDDYVNDLANTDWVFKSYTFTLSEQQKVCLLVMNSKKPGGNLLVDDASLKTTDGGIVGGGGVDPEPDPELDPYESNITMPTTADSKVDFYYNCTINNFASLKLGKSGFAGTWTSEVLGAAKTKLSFYSVAWTGKNDTSLTVEIVGGGTFEGGEVSKTISLTANTGFSGSGSSYSIVPVVDTDYHEYTLTGTTANSKIKFSTDKEHGAVFGVKVK